MRLSPPATPTPIAALLYAEGEYPDTPVRDIVARLREGRARLAGIIQRDIVRPDRRRCDMELEDLCTGARVALSEDRGHAARGCRIDMSGLSEAAARMLAALRAGRVDLLVVNKFGRVESEGGGLRDVLAEALSVDVPVLIGVPMRNLDAWEAFTGGLALRLHPPYLGLVKWLDAHVPHIGAGIAHLGHRQWLCSRGGDV